MTTLQLWMIIGLYGVALVLAAFFTRATGRRVAGALLGGAVVGAIAMGTDALGEQLGWWRMAIWQLNLIAVYASFFVSLAPVYLVPWRVERRFGWRGLAVATLILTVIGPPRDYLYVSKFPEWATYAPGIVPILAIAVLYGIMVPVGQLTMRLVAGPAGGDRLARSSHRP